MSAHTVSATIVSFCNLPGALKIAVVTVQGSASYDSGGSAADLSTSGNLGLQYGFQTVKGAIAIGQATAGNDKYYCTYVPATAATGLIKVRDLSAASDAEASGDISSVAWKFLVIGT